MTNKAALTRAIEDSRQNKIQSILDSIPVITTEDILTLWEDEPSWLERVTERSTFQVHLTDAELEWCEFIRGRYAIADLLWDSLQNADGERDTNAVTLDSFSVGKALRDDAVDRAPMLDESTGLAKLIWFIGPLDDYEWEQMVGDGNTDHRNIKDGY